MKVSLTISCVIFNIIGLQALIVPDEVPSILSIIYSNIPTLKKGTDSRFGWGFRLGDRADFQILTELGPQTNTQPLANQGEDGTNKRSAINTLANSLYAQRQHEKKLQQKQQQQQKQDKTKQKSSSSEGGQWLENWSKSVIKPEEEQKQETRLPLKGAKPGIAIGEIDAKSVIPDDDAVVDEKHKQQLKPKVTNKTISKKPSTENSLLSILTEGERPTS